MIHWFHFLRAALSSFLSLDRHRRLFGVFFLTVILFSLCTRLAASYMGVRLFVLVLPSLSYTLCSTLFP